MPAGALDHAGGDRPAAGQRGGVVQVAGLVGQVEGAGISSGSLSVVEPGDGGGPPDSPGDAGGLAVQDGASVVADPFLGGGVAFAVEAPGGFPLGGPRGEVPAGQVLFRAASRCRSSGNSQAGLSRNSLARG